jgi:hypothetical protein
MNDNWTSLVYLSDHPPAPLALRAAKQAISRSEDLALETGYETLSATSVARVYLLL